LALQGSNEFAKAADDVQPLTIEPSHFAPPLSLILRARNGHVLDEQFLRHGEILVEPSRERSKLTSDAAARSG
jgi:hypothetical protein